MLFTEAGLQLVEHLERQKDIPSLLASFQRFVLAFGMEGFCISDPSNPSVVRDDRLWGATWPVRWYWRYISQNHLRHDPVIRQMNRSTTPFRWSSTYAGAGRRGRRVLDEAAEFGFRDGFALGVHEDNAPVAGVSISARHYDLSKQDEMGLHLAALYLHARLARLRSNVASRPVPRQVVPLTSRERECLNWVASGKTDWEISQILAISEQTAHGYVHNAIIKLGARTRAQAVAVAILLCQIQP